MRTDNVFETRNGSWIEAINPLGLDILNKGTNRYFNFNTLVGSTGYGFRDNGGIMEIKNSGGSWQAIANGDVGGTDTQIQFNDGGVFAGNANFTFNKTTNQIAISNGSVSAPTLTWLGDLTTGFYHTGTGATGSILAAINGTKVFELTNTALKTTGLSVVMGAAALATNATTGFCYIPTCAGVPTGVPVAQSGTAAIVFDTTNSKLMIYAGSSW